MSNVNFNGFHDPEAYARQYAAKNNLSLEDAKTELQSKYGEPKMQPGGLFEGQSTASAQDNKALRDEDTELEALKKQLKDIAGLLEIDIENSFAFEGESRESSLSSGKFKMLSAMKDKMDKNSGVASIRTNPNMFLQQYTNENNLTLDEAKAELKKLFGEPGR